MLTTTALRHSRNLLLIKRFSTSTTKKATAPPRKNVSPSERAALRAARRERAAQSMLSQTQQVSGKEAAGTATVKKPTDPRIMYGLGLGIPTFLLGWGIADEDSPPAKFSRMIGLTDQVESFADEFARPSRAKLLPDWPMPNVPNIPCPHTLVLDLEGTLVHSSWDRKFGWRHAKRPGVDKFLRELAQYYEIVIYSPSVEGIAAPVVDALDKDQCAMHRLFRDACYYKKGIYLKDLSSLNRNVNKIILLDDDEAAAELNPRNLIRVKPYENPRDRNDNVLERITPFLVEVAREGYDNIPELLRDFQGMDSDEIADEMERRVADLMAIRKRGAGGLASFSGMGRRDMPVPEMVPQRRSSSAAPQGLTAKDVVGDAPGSEPDGAGLSGWLQRRQKDQAEQQNRKMEYWNEVMMKKQKEREAKAAAP